VVWIAGGTGKEGGIAALAPYFPRVAHAFLIGHDAPGFAETLAAHGVPHTVAGTLEAAIEAAARLARAPEVVLLSPAAASWDQFSGFDARGDAFRARVQHMVRSLA
jgi:UDP-N-acetylmuramoylalanine--D-glutamate ligase